MAPKTLVDHEQRAVLAAALKEICLTSGIEVQSREYDDAAQLLAHLYKNGHRSVEQLKSALDPATLAARFG
jgi:hypothetical protein